MFEYLNQNQGVVSAIAAVATALLTGIYVVTTIWLVGVSHRQAALAQKSIDVLVEIERNRSRPYVIFDITYDGVIAFAVLKNVGLSPAVDVKVTVDPIPRWRGDKESVGVVDHGIALLAPGREISEPCGAGPEFREAYPDLKFKGTVAYGDGKQLYTEAFAIDLNYAARMKSIGHPDVAEELKRIADGVELVVENRHPPLVRVLSEEAYPKYREEESRRRNAATFDRLKAMAEANARKQEGEAPAAEKIG